MCSSAEMTRQQLCLCLKFGVHNILGGDIFFTSVCPSFGAPFEAPSGKLFLHILEYYMIFTHNLEILHNIWQNDRFLRNGNIVCSSAEMTRQQFCLSLIFGVHNILGGDIFFTSVCPSFGAPFGAPSGEQFLHILSYYMILTHKLRQITQYVAK